MPDTPNTPNNNINTNNFIPNMILPNSPNTPNNLNNYDNDELWLQEFKKAADEIRNNPDQGEIEENQGPKINIFFVTTQGNVYNFMTAHGTTVDELIKKYLKRKGRLDLYVTKSKKICFLFNAIELKYGDKTPVEQLFKDKPNPKVVVNVNNLYG